MKKKPSTPLSREAEAFIEMLSAERGASLNTRAAYGADLKHLEAFLSRRKRKPVNADAEALRAYLKSLDYVGMTPRTVARRLSVIRQFFRFLLAERLRDDDPARTLDSPRLRGPLAQPVLERGQSADPFDAFFGIDVFEHSGLADDLPLLAEQTDHSV